MIGNDIPDLFRRMDAMMARMMSDMESGSPMEMADMPQGLQGYRIVIERGDLRPQDLIERTIGLGEAAAALPTVDTASPVGVTIIDPSI